MKMREEILFSERQHFKQIWLWGLLLIVNGFVLYGFISQVIFGKPFGDKPGSNTELTVALIIASLATLFFVFLRLDTMVKKDGVYYRYMPFQQKFTFISWERISRSFIRRYRPIIEYGGWGLRFGMPGRGKSYTVSGNLGLQLMYDDRKKVLIGTQRPGEMEKALKQIGQFYPDDPMSEKNNYSTSVM